MAGIQSSEVRVGLMVVLSIALLIALSITVGQLGDIFTDTIQVRIEIPKVAGLEPYSPVKYAGVPIGRIMGIHYDETIEQAVITADIKRDSPVSLDSICELSSSTMLSPLYVEISGGSREEKLKYLLRDRKIKEEDIVLGAKPYLTIGDLFALAGDIKDTLVKVQDVLDSVNEPLMVAGDVINNISNESDVLFNRVNSLLEDGHALVVDTLDHTNRLVVSASSEIMPALRNIKTSTVQLPDRIADINTKIDTLLISSNQLVNDINPEVKAVAAELKTAVQSLQKRIAAVETSMTTLLSRADTMLDDNQSDIRGMVQYLHRTSKNLDAMIEQLSEHPWRAIWKTEAQQIPSKVSPDWNPVLTKP